MFKLVVLSATLAVVATNPISFWGAGYTRPLAGSWNTPPAAGVIAPLASAIYTPFITSGPASSVGVPNYRGPLSLAPGQPANVLAADGRPLDTLSVNQDRAVHFNAQAVEGNGRRLQKRSIFAPLAGHVNAGHYAGGYLAGSHLVSAGHLAAVPLTLGRSWVGPAPIAPVAAAVAGTHLGGHLVGAGHLAAVPLTLGRSWVGPARIATVAVSVAAPIGPLGF